MPGIYPIPGTTTVEKVMENSVMVETEESEMQVIEKLLQEFEVEGERHHGFGMKLLDGQ